MTFTEVIRIIESTRVHRNISKRGLCLKAGITPQYYDLLLKNQSKGTFRVVNSLARALDMELKVYQRVELDPE